MITETTITGCDEDEAGAESQGLHLLVMSADVFSSQSLPAAGTVNIGRSSKCDVRVDDPMASREHARITIAGGAGGAAPILTIEDTGSANGTQVRDAALRKGQSAVILPGEAVIIGSTVIMVLQNRPPAGPRRLWSHAHFEARIEDECARAAKTRSVFALARVRFAGTVPWTRVMPILAREVAPPHVFASYGPRDYEILLIDTKEGEAEALVTRLVECCRSSDLDAQWAVAWYPKNGRSSDALLASANALLKVRSGPPGGSLPATLPVVAGMQRVRDLATRAASSAINVLILGETGVGKDVLAQLVHRLSPRAARPFVALNCAGFSDTLFESELFGYEKGAFTGAAGAKVGLFESAHGGTVFLDEIGDMPLPMQAKLLRVIETREVRPLGAVRSRPVDIRFVSATNKDLEAAVVRGEFRRDLMFRLNGITLSIPSLRDRAEEIPGLVDAFIEEGCREMGRAQRPTVSEDALGYLLDYHWPGNIRELKNEIERALVLCDGPVIGPEHLQLDKLRLTSDEYSVLPVAGAVQVPAEIRLLASPSLPPLADPAKAAERRRIMDALSACASNQTRAAQLLGISRRTLVSKLDQYGIPRPQKGHGAPQINGTVMMGAGSGEDGTRREPKTIDAQPAVDQGAPLPTDVSKNVGGLGRV